ncbi:hypothetical protein KFU94_29945 [Chloroflexi bacterium TSY]|nr:hypothetical protein [Chloroflexi bacterium TSY]
MHTDKRFTSQTWEELAHQWEREEITFEQLNGRLLVWIGHLHGMLVASQREQESMAHALSDLDARVQALETGRG